MADPTQEIALVTGAGSGLGAVIAECLAAEGLTVAVNTRAHADRGRSGRRHPRRWRLCLPGYRQRHRSVGGATHVRHRRRPRQATGPRQQCVLPPRQRVETITEDDWHQVRSVTLDGAFRCIRHALPALIPGGRIVNILGRNALAGDPERVHLSAAKHGLLGLTVALAAALRDDGVAVNAVSPEWTPTGPSSTAAAPKSLLR